MTGIRSPIPGAGRWQNAEPVAAPLSSLAAAIRADTRIVVLGSFPGAASLQARQYYAHPRNQFWPIAGAILDLPLTDLRYPDRIRALLDRGVGLWDVYASCRREGSLDAAIRDAVPNDLGMLPVWAPGLRLVAHNGAESARRMREIEALGLSALRLPSTSPANARLSLEVKLSLWREAFGRAGVFAEAT